MESVSDTLCYKKQQQSRSARVFDTVWKGTAGQFTHTACPHDTDCTVTRPEPSLSHFVQTWAYQVYRVVKTIALLKVSIQGQHVLTFPMHFCPTPVYD